MNIDIFIHTHTIYIYNIQICSSLWAPRNYTMSRRKTFQITATHSLFSVTWRMKNTDNIWLLKSLSPFGATRNAEFFGPSLDCVSDMSP